MALEKKPFVSYTLETERVRPKRDVFSVSLNEKERTLLDKFKEETGIPHDSKALKVLFVIGANVSSSIFGSQILKYLSSQDRTKTIN